MKDYLRSSLFRARSLPYCFTKLGSEGHVWLPLNRHYKPLGAPRDQYADYDKHIDSALVFARDPIGFKDVWHSTSGGRCYLYGDGTDLAADYFPRLERLLRHEHKYYEKPS